MKAIGGYFGLELGDEAEYYDGRLALNSGSNALKVIIKLFEPSTVHAPRYTCRSVIKTIEECGVKLELYDIDWHLEPKNLPIRTNDVTIVTNYFGIKNAFVNSVTNKYPDRTIADSCQAFFYEPIKGVAGFNSCRKFFGVPDGAYIFNARLRETDFQQGESHERADHLLQRVDTGPESGYKTYKENEALLSDKKPELMSRLSKEILKSVDYQQAIERRRCNYRFLDKHLNNVNKLNLPIGNSEVPMIYPFYHEEPSLRDTLIAKRIYVPKYWPNVPNRSKPNSIEEKLFNNLVPLPIDQRYEEDDMAYLTDCVIQHIQ